MKADAFWKPFEIEIARFDDLVKVFDQLKTSAVRSRTFAWRGLSDASWPLHSSLYHRLLRSKANSSHPAPVEANLAEREGRILKELHRWGLHFSEHGGRLSILNQLAMLQHYGAPTRLIDVTFNAWVGVWFAVEQKWRAGVSIREDVDARLFAIDVTDRLINERDEFRNWEDAYKRPWKSGTENGIDPKVWTTSVLAWKPANINARIAAQSGGFLLGGVPATVSTDGKKFQFPRTSNYKDGWWPIDEARRACSIAARPHLFKATGKLKPIPGALYTFRIKAAAKSEIRADLERLFGYRHSVIYPDYPGFASFALPDLPPN